MCIFSCLFLTESGDPSMPAWWDDRMDARIELQVPFQPRDLCAQCLHTRSLSYGCQGMWCLKNISFEKQLNISNLQIKNLFKYDVQAWLRIDC